MATLADARAVKSLNTGPGKRKFVYKSTAQQIAEIEIDVYRSLDPVKAEPSEGSTFFRDCLVEWRELNTAEDFISFYQEILPLVQTLPQILLQKEMILSKLVSRLQIKSRLSLEPILRLIAALSRDLLEDFLPFLQRIVNALVFLLKSGADREPEIIKQIFTSWSYIMMFLQKYLVKDVVHVLKVTLKLRYYPHSDIQKFMAESMSFLLRNAPIEQLIKGTRKIMVEVVKKPLAKRKNSAAELLWHVMKGSSSTLHSRAPQVFRLLLDEGLFRIGDQTLEGSDSVLEVLESTFERLSNELGPKELSLMWNCLYDEIIESKTNDHSVHLSRLLSLLVCIVRNGYMKKIPDYQPMFELVRLLVQTYVTPGTEEAGEQATEITDKILHLVLFIVDGLHKTKNLSALSDFSRLWILVFSLRNTSLVIFLKDLMLQDSEVLKVFRVNIISALNDLIEVSEEEALYLLLRLCENLQMPNSRFLDGISKEMFSRIYDFVLRTISYWIGLIKNTSNGDLSSLQLEESRLALLWGAINCYPYMFSGQENQSLLLDFLDAVDELLMVESGVVKIAWQSLIGATLNSYKKMLPNNGTGDEESAISKFLYLAKRYHTSSQILSPIADILDSLCGSVIQADTRCRRYHPELEAAKVVDALDTFAETLCHSDQSLRQSALRILCHYEHFKFKSSRGQPHEKRVGNDAPQTSNIEDCVDNVLELLLSIEVTGLSSISRKNELLISRIQMIISTTRVDETYVPALLYGMIGIFNMQLSNLWDLAMDCLAVLISKHFEIVWDRYIQYLDHFLSLSVITGNQYGRSGAESVNEFSDLTGYFNSSVSSPSGCVPHAKVFTLLIRSLQKVPTLVESKSRQLIPLFLKFLGYRVDDLLSVELYNAQYCKGKEWKEALKEWLNLFRLMPNPKSFYQSQLLKDVLLYRLLDDSDGELQLKVLDCLLNWKDDFLLPYGQHLKDLIDAKNLREELTKWSLSSESNQINENHRNYVVPIVIRILVPKVRKLKVLASRKHVSVHQRRAILGFLAELDVNELPLFFALLIKPLQTTIEGADAINKCLWSSPETFKGHLGSFSILKKFTMDGIRALSWKKRFGFLHVIEEVLAVFDESRIKPFLDLLMGCVVRILESCTATLNSTKCRKGLSPTDSSFDMGVAQDDIDSKTDIMTGTAIKQFKDLRSLCLKIISSVLGKYEDHDFSSEFWDSFFLAARPLISGFKQEGASSEKPSSLFSCFLAMSRSIKFVPLLCREESLVPDIFSMFTITTASDAIISCVFKFVENLLSLDAELGTENSSVKRLLFPHLNLLVNSMHCLFTHGNRTKRYPGDNELTVFNSLSKYIKEPLTANKFVDILLPLLVKSSQNSDLCVDILNIIQHVVEVVGSENSDQILSTFSRLLTFAGLEVRKSICDVLNALAISDSSVVVVANLLSELNATSAMEMGTLDYDAVIGAYEKINRDFFYSARKEHALIILSHSVYDMSSEELILRQSAYRLLLCFVDFATEILEGVDKSDECCWTNALIQHTLRNFLLKHMGNAMIRGTSVQKLWIDLLREMALKLPKVANLGSYRTLHSQDPEQDFFNNIIHLQKHRRARALSRFTQAISSGNLSEVITTQVFVPLFFNLLFSVQDGKDENIRSACLGAIASISGRMSWKEYYNILMRCFREMTKRREKQKILLRLICSILDHFHFSETFVNNEADDSAEDILDAEFFERMSSVGLRRRTLPTEFSDIQTCIQKMMLPKIQKLSTSNSDNVNVNISLVALKLLKLLPGEIMDSQLPNIVHRISNFLNHRLGSVRDEARSALAACLKELGLGYLQFIVKVLRGTLKNGRELHILGYTLNFLLSKFLMEPINGRLDDCLEDLLSVIENDLLGDVSEQKEVDKFASKMKETRKQKSFETLKLVAQSITFRTHAVKLLSIVTVHLQKQLTPKMKLKLENMLANIAAGIESNPSADQTELFIFVYRLVKDGTDDENQELKITQISKTQKQDEDAMSRMNNPVRLINVESRYSHLITGFALGLLQNHMKGMKLDRKDEQQLSMLDPFISLLGDCLDSKYENIVSTALRCLSTLVRLPLPSLESQADKIKNSLLFIAQGSSNSGSPLMDSCLRLLTVLLRSTSVTLSTDHLHMLIQFPLFVDIERSPSFVCLSLLKAIVNKKLVVPEIYDVVKRVAELMVTCQMEPIRKQCSQILLQFLLDYRLSEKRLQQHLDFLLVNLRYEHSSGREAVLEMIHAIIMKFPGSILDEQSQTIFVHLVVSLANDHDNKVRSMTGAAIKLLFGRVSSHSLHAILEYSLSWYMSQKQHLWSAAAQVLGLLVEVMKQGFQKYLSNVVPVIGRILHSGVNNLVNSQLDLSSEATVPLWKEAYYSLVLLEKILSQFQKFCFEKDLEEIWEVICEFLLHPHLWLRKISSRLVAFYFSHVTEGCRETLLMRPSRLFLIAASLCCQLKSQPGDDASNLITHNLVLAICHLHSLLGQFMDFPKFWSNLEDNEQGCFLKAFHVLDSGKGRSTLAYLTSDDAEPRDEQKNDRHQHFLVLYLLKKMGKISLQIENIQMKVVFHCFKSISPVLLGQYKNLTPIIEDDVQNYAYQILLPIYRVCEGYAGRVVADDMKQLAQEVCESIRDSMGVQNFVQYYSRIQKNIKSKRDKRKQEEKLMAVVNPMRNAKRKLRIAAKHRAHKKRKIMTMKMGRWLR